MSEPLPEQTAAQIRSALAAGNKIEAIRLYREFSSAGLAEAKAFIEQLERGDHLAAAPAPPDATSRVHEALFAGKKIEAIRVHREAVRCGLAEAKAAVEQIEARLRASQPERFTAPASKGCLVSVLVAGALAALTKRL